MSNESLDKGLVNFLKRAGTWVIGLLTFVTTIIGAIQILRGDRGLVGIILLFIGIGTLWLSAIYVYFKKEEPYKKAGFITKGPSNKTARSSWKHTLALVVITAIPIATVLAYAGWKHYQSLPSNKVIILIARFDGPDKDYGITESIIEKLREATKGFDDVLIQPLGETITAEQGSSFAHEKGKDYKASVVLWGWYRKTSEKVLLTAHFEVLRNLETLELRNNTNKLELPASDLENLTVHAQLAGEVKFFILLAVGIIRFEVEDYDGAISRFTAALTPQPTIPEQLVDPSIIYFLRGRAFTKKDNLEDAILDYDQALTLKPDFTDAYFSRGSAKAQRSDYDNAITDFSKALNGTPSLNQSRLSLVYSLRGFVYALKGSFDPALADANKAIEIAPDFYYPYLMRASIYQLKKEPDPAIEDFTHSLNLRPDPALKSKLAEMYTKEIAPIYVERGQCFIMKKDLDRALTDFNTAVRLKPDYADAYYWRGFVNHRKGEIDNAIEGYTQAIELQPNFIEARYGRGDAYLVKEDFSKAIDDLEYVLNANPNERKIYFILDSAFQYKKDSDLTHIDLLQGIDLKKKLAGAYYGRGQELFNRRDIGRALDSYNRTIQLDSEFTPAYLERGNVFIIKEDFDRALAEYTTAIKQEPDNFKNYANRAGVFIIKKNFKLALADYEYAIKLNPSEPTLRISLAKIYEEMGDCSKAISTIDEAARLSPNSRSYIEQKVLVRCKR